MTYDGNPGNFELNAVIRDGIQSNNGTNLSADEIISMMTSTIADNDFASFEISGGTFVDLFLKKGRDAFGENTKLFEAFEGVVTSALIRSHCLVGYTPNPQDVIDAVIEEMAEMGLNKVRNFHGLNFTPAQESVFQAVHKARENGYDIIAPKTLCIEDNPNITVEGCMTALAAQVEAGADEGIELKNASGKCDPEFVYELVKRIGETYPGEKVTIHTHDNHGMADAIYMRGAEAGAEMNMPMAFDVLPTPLASGTAQPPAWRTALWMQNHPSKKLQARAAQYDESKELADAPAQYEKRHQYAASEVRYSKDTWYKCYLAGMAGGAMSAIKGMGILGTVKGMYGLADEDEALGLIADIEVDVKHFLGYPTSVTPFQKTMDEQAALEARLRKDTTGQWRKNKTGDYQPFSQLDDNAAFYLAGGLGPVPVSASPRLIQMALDDLGLDKMIEFVPPSEMEPLMEVTRQSLIAAGMENPSRSDVSMVAMFGNAAFDEVLIRSGQSNMPRHFEKATITKTLGRATGTTKDISVRTKPKPQQQPQLPHYLQKPSENYQFKSGASVHTYDVAMAIGGAAELEKFALAVTEIQKHEDGFYKTEIGPLGFYQKAKMGTANQNSEITAPVGYLHEVQSHAYKRAEDEIQDFIDAIPERLKEYGMTQKQAAGAVSRILPDLLAEVIERKAKGASQRALPEPSRRISQIYANDNTVGLVQMAASIPG